MTDDIDDIGILVSSGRPAVGRCFYRAVDRQRRTIVHWALAYMAPVQAVGTSGRHRNGQSTMASHTSDDLSVFAVQ